MTDQNTLDAELVLAGLEASARADLSELIVRDSVDSTNREVFRLPEHRQHACAVLADEQTGGRGRRQRSWFSPAGGNIYLSLGWRFEDPAGPLSTLPLVVGLAVCRALDRVGLYGHSIKWPNDILAGGKKLAGILVELKSSGNGPSQVVIGVGLNVCMPVRDQQQLEAAIGRPWTDLQSELPGDEPEVSRNGLAAMLLEELIESLGIFDQFGFEVFREHWSERDVLRGTKITLEFDDRHIAGIARGVDGDGGLLLQTDEEGVRAYHSGEVSVHRG